MALYAVVPMLPGLERLFGTPPGSTHLGISLPFLLLVLLSPLVPRIHLPVGSMVGGGLLGVGLFGILAGLAPSLEIWTLCRTLQGAFAAAVPGLSLALLPKLYPRKHAQMAGFWVAGNVLGGGLGRGLGGLLAEWLGERLAMVLLALPVGVTALFVLGAREHLTLPAPRYTLSAWPLYALGFALLFINFFVANLMPYRLEALGLSQGQIGGIFFAYLAGIPGSALAGTLVKKWGVVAAFRLAFGVVALGLLIQIPNQPLFILVGFVTMMAGIFTAQAITGGGFGAGRQRGQQHLHRSFLPGRHGGRPGLPTLYRTKRPVGPRAGPGGLPAEHLASAQSLALNQGGASPGRAPCHDMLLS